MQGRAPGKTQRERAIDKHSIGKWKANLSERHSQEIWEVVGDFMETLGYQVN